MYSEISSRIRLHFNAVKEKLPQILLLHLCPDIQLHSQHCINCV